MWNPILLVYWVMNYCHRKQFSKSYYPTWHSNSYWLICSNNMRWTFPKINKKNITHIGNNSNRKWTICKKMVWEWNIMIIRMVIKYCNIIMNRNRLLINKRWSTFYLQWAEYRCCWSLSLMLWNKSWIIRLKILNGINRIKMINRMMKWCKVNKNFNKNNQHLLSNPLYIWNR